LPSIISTSGKLSAAADIDHHFVGSGSVGPVLRATATPAVQMRGT
jgi:hypothetical protein